MIEFVRVTRSYGKKVAVSGLDLSLRPGELFAFLGPNGAGKTTTIKMLVSLLRPSEGAIRVGGYDTVSQARQVTHLMGYVPDQPFLYDKLTGREFLLFVAQMRGLSDDQAAKAIDRESERFDLGDFLDDLTETCSHGMRQRLAFASALLHRPVVLVVDEPMVGLDPKNTRMVKDLLRELASSGTTVFMSTHTLNIAEEIADRIGIIHEGRLEYLGTLDGLRDRVAVGAEPSGGNGAGSALSGPVSLEQLFLQLTASGNGRSSGAADRSVARE